MPPHLRPFVLGRACNLLNQKNNLVSLFSSLDERGLWIWMGRQGLLWAVWNAETLLYDFQVSGHEAPDWLRDPGHVVQPGWVSRCKICLKQSGVCGKIANVISDLSRCCFESEGHAHNAWLQTFYFFRHFLCSLPTKDYKDNTTKMIKNISFKVFWLKSATLLI